MSENQAHHHSWKQSFSVYFKSQCVTMLFLGFSAGLPFMLVFTTLNLWLKSVQLDTAIIGYFSFIGITYSIKVAWSPIVDRLRIPILTRLLGHRRSWMLIAQLGIAIGLVSMALTDPTRFPFELAIFGLLVAFSAATQDISVDAFRIEAADYEYQTAMSAMYVLGYRLAILVSGAGALYIAKYGSWTLAYIVMAAFVSVGVITVLLIKEPIRTGESKKLMPRQEVFGQFLKMDIFGKILSSLFAASFIIAFLYIVLFFAGIFPILLTGNFSAFFGFKLIDLQFWLDNRHTLLWSLLGITLLIIVLVILFRNTDKIKKLINWVIGSVIGPLVDFFYRFGWLFALMIIMLVLTYRISDIYMGSMATVLYKQLGFDLADIANITKVFGLIMTIVGAALGGVLVMRYGIMRPLLVGAIIVAITNIFFSELAHQGAAGRSLLMLTAVIAMDNLSGGLAQTAFIGYLSSLVNKQYTATQYALFSSLMTLPGKILSGFSGETVKYKGYEAFFVDASLFGIPAIFLIVTLILLKHIPDNIRQDSTPEELKSHSNIRGILIIPIVSLFITPIVLAVFLSKQIIPAFASKIAPKYFVYQMFSSQSNYYDPSGAWLMVFALIAIFVIMFTTIYMLRLALNKKKKFKTYIIFYYATIAIVFKAFIFLKFQITEKTTHVLNLFFDPMAMLIVVGCFTFIWIPYFLFSGRVKRTFVN